MQAWHTYFFSRKSSPEQFSFSKARNDFERPLWEWSYWIICSHHVSSIRLCAYGSIALKQGNAIFFNWWENRFRSGCDMPQQEASYCCLEFLSYLSMLEKCNTVIGQSTHYTLRPLICILPAQEACNWRGKFKEKKNQCLIREQISLKEK